MQTTRDNPTLHINTPAQTEFLLHRQEKAAKGTGLYVNVNKTEFISFKQKGAISILNGKPQGLVDQFTYFSSNISSTESDMNIHLVKMWNAIDRLSILWKSDFTNKIKQDFSYILLYGRTTRMLAKCIEKKLDRNCTRILCAVLNKSWKKHPTKQQLYGHLTLISQIIRVI